MNTEGDILKKHIEYFKNIRYVAQRKVTIKNKKVF